MAVRATMATLISRVRLLIADAGATQQFQDQQIQDFLDNYRMDVFNEPLMPKPTFSGSTISYFDYFADLGQWEDDLVLKQYLITQVTPATSENIVGHWTFAATTLPPVFITGKTYDLYRSAADLLEFWAATFVLAYDATVDGQSLRLSQQHANLLTLADQYRRKSRAHSISVIRSDTRVSPEHLAGSGLGPLEIDRFAKG
jgi:hypothetical protein